MATHEKWRFIAMPEALKTAAVQLAGSQGGWKMSKDADLLACQRNMPR